MNHILFLNCMSDISAYPFPICLDSGGTVRQAPCTLDAIPRSIFGTAKRRR